MLLAILIVGVIVTAYIFYRTRWLPGIPISLVAVALLGLIAVAFTTFAGGKMPETHPLSAINDGQQTHGSFFLGSGVVDEDAAFMYYEQDGAIYRLKSAPAWASEVRYTTGHPRVVSVCENENPPAWATEPLFTMKPSRYCGRHAHYIFYVPQGSIVDNYRLDAK